MQLQALIRAAEGRDLHVMFPFIADCDEYHESRAMLLAQLEREAALGHAPPTSVRIGAMLETPSLAFAPDAFFRECDFISIGGNDLKQFFFAADRENERVRKRYDTLSVPFLNLVEMIVRRCAALGVPLSFCGEDAGRPVEAAVMAALGLTTLSMRPASIGPVKALLRRTDLRALRALIDDKRESGATNLRPAVTRFLAEG